MSWLALVLIVVGVYLAIKLVGFVLKAAMWLLVLVGLYWLLAPVLGLPWF